MPCSRLARQYLEPGPETGSKRATASRRAAGNAPAPLRGKGVTRDGAVVLAPLTEGSRLDSDPDR